MNRRITMLLVAPVLLVACWVAPASAQQATLVVPEALDVVSVDNKKYSSSLFSSGDSTLKLEPGQHRIVVKYDIIWDIGYDDHENIQSEPFQITFSVEPGKHYAIKLPFINQLEKARQYANKPVFEFIDRSLNQRVASEVTYRQFDGTFVKHVNVPAVTTQSTQVPVPAASLTQTAISQQANLDTTSNMPLKMLEYWWEKADAQQRKLFIKSR